jgi:hypothetical protein
MAQEYFPKPVHLTTVNWEQWQHLFRGIFKMAAERGIDTLHGAVHIICKT